MPNTIQIHEIDKKKHENRTIALLLTGLVFLLGLIFVNGTIPTCSSEEKANGSTAPEAIDDPLELARASLSEKLEEVPEVFAVTTGHCDGAPCLKVHLEHRTPELEQAIPKEWEGVNVQIGEVTLDDIARVNEKYQTKIWSIPGVVGYGTGDCEGVLCIHVYVLRSHPEAQRAIPQELDGIKVKIIETEGFKAQ